jgi:hypothetical protein
MAIPASCGISLSGPSTHLHSFPTPCQTARKNSSLFFGLAGFAILNFLVLQLSPKPSASRSTPGGPRCRQRSRSIPPRPSAKAAPKSPTKWTGSPSHEPEPKPQTRTSRPPSSNSSEREAKRHRAHHQVPEAASPPMLRRQALPSRQTPNHRHRYRRCTLPLVRPPQPPGATPHRLPDPACFPEQPRTTPRSTAPPRSNNGSFRSNL